MVLLLLIIFILSITKLARYYLADYQSHNQIQTARKLYQHQHSQNKVKVATVNSKKETYPSITTQVTVGIKTSPSNPLNSKNHPLTLDVQPKFRSLLKINPDVVGWIKIDGTVINYPVLQTSNNDYYLSHDLNKKKNVNGSIFMDYRNHINFPEKHWILYGHNMKNKSMFMSLLNYESKWYFDHHNIIEFDTLYKNEKWQVFSAYTTTIKDDYIQTNFKTSKDFENYINEIQKKSLYHTNVKVSVSDRILTLSTCSGRGEKYRFVVQAKLIPSSS